MNPYNIDLSVLKKIIKNFPKPRILVLGDLMLDAYLEGDSNRVSPEAPVPIIRAHKEEYKIGGAGNVAANISELGGNVSFVGTVGNDSSGKRLNKLLKNEGVNTYLVIENKQTTIKKRIISMNQQLLRIDYENPAPTKAEKLFSILKKLLKKCDCILISDYAKGCVTEDLIKFITKNSKVPVIVDPKQPMPEFYKNCTIITPNEGEAVKMGGLGHSTLHQVANFIEKKSKAKVLITRGAKGMSYIKKDSLITIPTIAKEAYDVTGAGDTVAAVLALSIAAGAKFEEAAFLANQAAGIVVEKFGTNTVSISELQQAFEDEVKKIKTQEQLAIISSELRKSGKKVVFTNGCFDILHAGHVNILQRSKALGDVLMLGLNTDASVRKLKGKERPIISERERAELLAALEVVDYVTFFDEDTPVNIVKKIRPSIHVKGGDYQRKDLPEARVVEKYGGKVVILPFVKGFSTTSILNRIKNNHDQK